MFMSVFICVSVSVPVSVFVCRYVYTCKSKDMYIYTCKSLTHMCVKV